MQKTNDRAQFFPVCPDGRSNVLKNMEKRVALSTPCFHARSPMQSMLSTPLYHKSRAGDSPHGQRKGLPPGRKPLKCGLFSSRFQPGSAAE